MIIDKDLFLADAQAVTASAATKDSDGNATVIDLSVAGDAIENELYVVFRVDTTATADGLATVTFALQTSASSDFSSAITLLSTGAIAKASLTEDTIIYKAKIPQGVLRYLRGYFTVATGPLTAGKFDVFLTTLAPTVV